MITIFLPFGLVLPSLLVGWLMLRWANDKAERHTMDEYYAREGHKITWMW